LDCERGTRGQTSSDLRDVKLQHSVGGPLGVHRGAEPEAPPPLQTSIKPTDQVDSNKRSAGEFWRAGRYPWE
jgi:hypothetical protein